MSTATTKDLKAILNPREAFRFGYSINPATGSESLSRGYWVNEDRYQESAKFLDKYTDASTTDNDSPVETEYITTPSVGRAATFLGKWVHSGCSQSEEANKLIQILTRVYDITTNALLFERQAIPTYDNNILNLFGLAESEGDAVAFVIYELTKESRAFCMAIADSDLITGLAGAGFTYAGRRFEVDPETNSARLTVACQKVAHNAFDYELADLEWYHYKTTKQEQKHQAWMLIDNDDPLTGLYTAGSGYNVTTVEISESEKGSLKVHRTQLLEGYGATDDEYAEAREEILNPFGEASGTKNHVTVLNHHLKSKTTAYGTIDSTRTGYTLVDTSESEEGNGLWTILYKYEKVTWLTWGHDSYAADETDYGNAESDRETITKQWKGIRLSDIDTAVSDCRTGTNATPESDHIITDVNVSETAQGSFQITQVQTKQINGEQNTRAELTQPHALKSGILAQVTIRYENFHEASLPAPSNYVPGTDSGVISNIKTGPDGQGLWSRIIVTETMTWAAWSDAAADIIARGNEGTVSETINSSWIGIRKADQATAIAALIDGGAIGATTGYTVDTVGVSDNKNGSLTFTQTQIKMIKGASESEIEEDKEQKIAPFGIPSAGTLNRVRIINSNLDSPSSAYVTLSASKTGYTIIDTDEQLQQGSGLWTVIHTYEKMTWKTFVPDVTLYDTQDVSNQGRDSEIRTKTWDHIQKADLATAVAFLDSTADADYYVTRLNVSDNKNGSIRLVQTSSKRTNGATNTKVEGIGPHSLKKGILSQTTTLYFNFDEGDLPAGTDPTDSNDYIVNQKTGPDSDGFYSRTNITETVSWFAFVASVTGYTTQDVSSPDRENETRTKTWEGVQNADLATAVAFLDSNADADYYVARLVVSDNKNGSIRLVQTSSKAINGAENVRTAGIDSLGLRKGLITRTTTIYRDFSEAGLPAGTDPTTGNAYTLNEKTGPDNNGFYNRTNTQEVVTWYSFSADVTTYTLQNISNPDRDNETRIKTWSAIQKADLATAVTFLETNADADYNVHRLTVSDNRNGSITLVQTTSKEVNAAIGGKVEGINSHSLSKGLLNQTVTIYQNFDESGLPAGTDPTSTNTYVLNQKQGPDSQGFYSRTNVLETTTWFAWGTVTPITSYQNVGTPTETRSLRWVGVQKGDLATAVAEVVAGTTTADYEVKSVAVRDNQNGSITISQSISQQTDGGVGEDGIIRVNPHDLDSASTLSTVTTSTLIYVDFIETDLPAGTDPILGNNIISNLKGRQGNGLYRRVVTTQTVSTNGSWTNKVQIGERSSDGQAKSQTHEATGLPLSGLVAAFTAAVADSGFVAAAKSIRYSGNGRFTLTRIQQNTEDGTAESDAVIVKLVSGDVGNNSPTIVREWYRRTKSAKDSLMAGAAIADISYGGDVYTHDNATVTDHHDGSFTVRQTGVDTVTGLTWFMDTDMDIYSSQSRTKDGVEQYRLIAYKRYTKFRNSWNDCQNAMEGINSPGDNVYLTRPGSPQDMGNGLWTVTFDAADTDTMYAFNSGDWADV